MKTLSDSRRLHVDTDSYYGSESSCSPSFHTGNSHSNSNASINTADSSSSLIPPPLPQKKRSPGAGVEVLQSLSSRTSSLCVGAGQKPDPSNPANRQLSPSHQYPVCPPSPMSSIISSASLDHSLGVAGGMPPMVQPPPKSPLQCQGHDLLSPTELTNQLIMAANSGGNLGQLISLASTHSSHSSRQSSSHHQITTTSSSTTRPANGINQEKPDSNSNSLVSQAVSRTHSDSKIVNSSSSSSNSSAVFSRTSNGNSGKCGGKAGSRAFDEINQLTSRIKQLTEFAEEIPPPLPAKKGSPAASVSFSRLNSQYDNVPESFEEKIAALSAHLANSDNLVVSQTTSTSQQRHTSVVMRKDQQRISSLSNANSQSSQSNQR